MPRKPKSKKEQEELDVLTVTEAEVYVEEASLVEPPDAESVEILNALDEETPEFEAPATYEESRELTFQETYNAMVAQSADQDEVFRTEQAERAEVFAADNKSIQDSIAAMNQRESLRFAREAAAKVNKKPRQATPKPVVEHVAKGKVVINQDTSDDPTTEPEP